MKIKINEDKGNKRVITIDKEGMKEHEYHITNYNMVSKKGMTTIKGGVYDYNQTPSLIQIKSDYKDTDTITISKGITNNDSLLLRNNESKTKPPALSINSLFSSYSKQSRELFEYWDSFCDILPRVLLKESNTFHKAMQDIENALSRGYKPDEIATAMTHYYNLVSDGTTKLYSVDSFASSNSSISIKHSTLSSRARISSSISLFVILIPTTI